MSENKSKEHWTYADDAYPHIVWNVARDEEKVTFLVDTEFSLTLSREVLRRIAGDGE